MSDLTYNGINLTLTSDADYSNRLLPGGYVNYHEASAGEAYDFEMQATATDEAGNSYLVYWIYEGVKGDDDRPLDWYDYSSDEIDRIEVQ
ncbi:hypothetical protein [Sulfuriferula multivorans]|nr:hypothetical protein [Sulfuriferula multivorans]